MDNKIKIIDFTSDYIEKAIDILAEYNQFHKSNFPEFYKDTEREDEIDFIKWIIEDENNSGYIAFDGEKPVGIALFGLVSKPSNFTTPEVTYLYEMVVKEEYRSQGIGRALMHKIVEYSKTRGIEKIELEITHGNERGIAFYKEIGFYDYSKIMLMDI